MAKFTDKNKRPMTITPEYQNIPAELRARKQWVLWRFDWNEEQKVWAKVPYHPRGFKASSTNPSNWSSFESCLLTFEQSAAKYDGLGFVFAAEDGLVGVDLDNCIRTTNGEIHLSAFAADVVEKLATYTEISPSQTGIHCIGKASVLESVKTNINGNEIEMYSKERYFTFTGKSWQDEPRTISDIQRYSEEILTFSRSKKGNVTINENQSKDSASDNLDLESRLQIALKYERFKRLFNGDIAEYAGDDSRADMSLCGMLAFYTDGRADAIDALFRRSKLMRVKWDALRGGQTYGQLTIDKVLSQPRDYYSQKKQDQKPMPVTPETRKSYRFSFHDLWDRAMSYRESGDARGVSTGWAALDKFYKPTKRALHIVTGKPSSGKSTFVDALCSNLAFRHKWKFTFAAFETLPIERHILNLCQIHLAKPTFAFAEDAATDAEMEKAHKEIGDYFHFVLPPDDQMNITNILNYVDDDLREHEIDGFVLDPFTELDQTPNRGQTQTHAIKDILRELQMFTRRRDLATWLIVHPTKPNKDTYLDGRPTLYSLADSANFYNKADFGLVVDRDDADKTTVYVEKVRNDINGKKGQLSFTFHKHSKMYVPLDVEADQSDVIYQRFDRQAQSENEIENDARFM